MVDFTAVILEVLTNLWNSFVEFIPSLFSAILVLIIGYIFAVLLKRIMSRAMRGAKVDLRAKSIGLDKALFGISITNVLANALKWYVVIVSVYQACIVLNLTGVVLFINSFLVWIPNAVIGALMIVAGLAIANFFAEGIRKQEILFADIISTGAYGVILYFSIVLALPKFGFTQIDILVDSFKYLVAGVAAGIAIAIGLAFGMALKEPIEDVIKKKTRKRRSK
jgi:hypothetical protein